MRERPEGALFEEVGYSFPSSHASVAFSMIAMMNREFPGIKWIFVVVALLITFSRIYLGVHYASDLVAGGFLGFGIGLIILERKKVLAKIKTLR
jgi:undecaprenyl-diphosphatase